MKKKIIAIILSVLMLLSVAPLSVMAAELGDVDSNGKVDATDARTALRAAVGLDKLTAEKAKLADVDFDGDVDATDARLILRAAVGLEDLHVHSYTSAVTTAATCEGKGVKTFTCSCGDSYTEDIPALGHKAVTDKAVAPTCTEKGKTEGTHCSVCNAVLKKQEAVPALGHKAVTDKAVAATCTEAGLTEGSHCSVCNTVLKAQETVPALGHKAVTDKAVAATCTEAGLTEGSHCSVCNAVIKAQETVPAKGHTSVTDKAVAPTCTANGKTEGAHCSVCNAVLKPQALVNALGHTSVTDKAVAATCTEAGLTEGAHCSVCNTVIKAQETVPALGHKAVTDKAVAATCTEAGLTEGAHCSVCNTVIKAQETVPAKGHTSVTDKAVAATCTEAGLTEGAHCSVCNTVLTAQETVPATGHLHSSLDESTVIAENCKTEGYTGDYKCDACGTVTASGETIPVNEEAHDYKLTTVPASCSLDEYTAWLCSYCGSLDSTKEIIESGTYPGGKGHSFGEKTTVAPTCENEGYDTKTCPDCTYEERDNFVPAIGHKYEKNDDESVTATCLVAGKTVSYCQVCQDKKTEELGFAACVPITEKQVGTSYATGDSCKTVEKCSVCEKVISEAENYGAHKNMIPVKVVAATCETAGTRTLRCRDCGYEYIAVAQDALGHLNENHIELPDCENPGYIISSGVCMREGCGKDMGEGTRIDLPAKGHRESGVQSCVNDVICLECNKVTKPAFGHNFVIESPAITSGSKSMASFFCTRCGEACGDKKNQDNDKAIKIATFNAVTDKIKTGFYDNGTGRLHRLMKMSTENIPSNINFGIWTSTVRDMFEEDMAETPVTYSLYKDGSMRWTLPFIGKDYVSLLEADDVDSVSVERISGLDFSQVLSGFDDKFTSGKNERDLTPYKAIKVTGDVIKVTIDVKNEKYYGGIDKLPAAEMTSLQKIFGVDIRDQLFPSGHTVECPASCSSQHYVNGGEKLYMSTSEDGMSMKMTLNDLTTDGKVTYYFLEETYQPIVAVYEEIESMNQHMDMSISVGISIKGSMDTLSKTNSETVYVFPGYQPAV